MHGNIKYTNLPRKSGNELEPSKDFGLTVAEKVNAFHRSFPEYCETPLRSLSCLSKRIGLGGIYVKDESYRFGLNAFKALGGSYAIGQYIAGKLGEDIENLPYERMTSGEIKSILGDTTFVTATDGNHGRGVAWTAARLGQKSVVYMPKGTAAERLENIKKLGSNAEITELNYDDCVRLAKTNAEKYGWAVIQDTSWEGYEIIPKYIMQGYTTMAYEAAKQLGDIKPTHIFLQAGVGAMAGAVCGFFADYYGEDMPVVTIVEPTEADCIFRTAQSDDGKLHFVTGDMQSIMAGLCCGEPCKPAWDIINGRAQHFFSVPDSIAELGMRTLGKPFGDDEKVVSGESGAATIGLVTELMQNPVLADLRSKIGLDKNSIVLCFSTEGATDKANYDKIMQK